jgi:hypothetical protein
MTFFSHFVKFCKTDLDKILQNFVLNRFAKFCNNFHNKKIGLYITIHRSPKQIRTKFWTNFHNTNFVFLYMFLVNQMFISHNFLLCRPSQRSVRSQVPSQVITHQKIGSQLRAGETSDSNPWLQDKSQACYHHVTPCLPNKIKKLLDNIVLFITTSSCQLRVGLKGQSHKFLSPLFSSNNFSWS